VALALAHAGVAHAQTAPPRTPARPAAGPSAAPAPAAAAPADGATRTLGTSGGSGSGPLLTRDELRACLAQQESIRKRLEEHDAQRVALSSERDALVAEKDTLGADRARIDVAKKALDDLGARFAAYGNRVTALNDRVARFDGMQSRGGPTVDRERNAIERERAEIEKERVALDADRTRLVGEAEAAVKSFNDKAGALDARMTGWNERNGQWNGATTTIESDREQWVRNCANRRYREDDETAIRRGQ
jgi:chromosome segregation ATPase